MICTYITATRITIPAIQYTMNIPSPLAVIRSEKNTLSEGTMTMLAIIIAAIMIPNPMLMA